MRLTTFAFALCVISARCATIPDKIAGDIEKKIEDAVREVLSKDQQLKIQASEKQLDQSNVISKVDNGLKKVDLADIPVNVIVTDVKQSLRGSEEKISSVEDAAKTEIKREEIDLKNPGIAQRQEHETQNPEHHEEENVSSFIRQNVLETQIIFNNEVELLQKKIKVMIGSDQQEKELQEQFQHLQDKFKAQIEKLSKNVQKYVPKTEEAYIAPALRTLPDTDEIDSKSTKVEGKQEPAPPTASPVQPSQNPIAQYFQQLQQSISNNIAQMQEQMQSYFNNNNQQSSQTSQPSGAQADEGAATPRPSLWQSFTNIFNPANNQANQQADTPASAPTTPNRPIVQAIQSNIQNNPIYQSVASVFNPNRPSTNTNKPEAQKPEAASATQASQPAAEKPESDASSQGTNSVPAKPAAQKQKPETPQYGGQSGPIKQILIEKNPIVQGFAGAVQRIQQSINNPDKPRDDVKKAVSDPEEKKHGHGSQTQAEHNHNVDRSGVEATVEEVDNKPEALLPVEPLKEAQSAKPEQSPAEKNKKTE